VRFLAPPIPPAKPIPASPAAVDATADKTHPHAPRRRCENVVLVIGIGPSGTFQQQRRRGGYFRRTDANDRTTFSAAAAGAAWMGLSGGGVDGGLGMPGMGFAGGMAGAKSAQTSDDLARQSPTTKGESWRQPDRLNDANSERCLPSTRSGCRKGALQDMLREAGEKKGEPSKCQEGALG